MAFESTPDREPGRLHIVRSDRLRTALTEPSAAKRLLRRELPKSWRFAHQVATDLVRQVKFLAWAERADTFDTYLLRQAEGMLRSGGLTQLVTGPFGDRPAHENRREFEERARRFRVWSRATVSAALLELDEGPEVSDAHQALTYLLTHDLVFARAAAAWTAAHGMASLEDILRQLPGYALVLLATSPNDTAARFLARDAFWLAVLGAR